MERQFRSPDTHYIWLTLVVRVAAVALQRAGFCVFLSYSMLQESEAVPQFWKRSWSTPRVGSRSRHPLNHATMIRSELPRELFFPFSSDIFYSSFRRNIRWN